MPKTKTAETTTLQLKTVSVKKLEPNPWNFNRVGEDEMDRLRATITQDGFVDPVTVRELTRGNKVRYQIIDGEHRWLAARSLKLAKIPVINLGVVDDTRAKSLTIKLRTWGESDPGRLARLISEIIDDGVTPDTLPYDAEHIAALQKLALQGAEDFEPPDVPETPPSTNGGKKATKKNDGEDEEEDIYQFLRLGAMKADEVADFKALVKKLASVLGSKEKKPYKLLVTAMQEVLHRRKKKKKKKSHAHS